MVQNKEDESDFDEDEDKIMIHDGGDSFLPDESSSYKRRNLGEGMTSVHNNDQALLSVQSGANSTASDVNYKQFHSKEKLKPPPMHQDFSHFQAKPASAMKFNFSHENILAQPRMIGQVSHPKSPKLNARERKNLRKDKEQRKGFSGSMVNIAQPHKTTVS